MSSRAYLPGPAARPDVPRARIDRCRWFPTVAVPSAHGGELSRPQGSNSPDASLESSLFWPGIQRRAVSLCLTDCHGEETRRPASVTTRASPAASRQPRQPLGSQHPDSEVPGDRARHGIIACANSSDSGRNACLRSPRNDNASGAHRARAACRDTPPQTHPFPHGSPAFHAHEEAAHRSEKTLTSS